jgi:hypothetical protein
MGGDSPGAHPVNRYDPERAPNAAEWLALDEWTRIALVETYHRRARVQLPNRKAHAVFHVIVENQIAENLEPVVRAMSRLTAAGLARHDVVHAIAAVVAAHVRDLLTAGVDAPNAQAAYHAAIERLDARS